MTIILLILYIFIICAVGVSVLFAVSKPDEPERMEPIPYYEHAEPPCYTDNGGQYRQNNE